MINFNPITREEFLNDYWQKKPMIFRQAIKDFKNPIDPDELAGLALEEDIESRIVIQKPGEKNAWHLKTGPFLEKDFTQLPSTHWTLLVQGVDRFVPEVTRLLDHFNFLPQWRFDDVMISYAVNQGSVGPHYDNYDVFLYQALGSRKWSLSRKHCEPHNALPDTPLRIMECFEVEEEIILEEGDMLYLPAFVAHYGISLSDDCMTYSFGYRSYPEQELWDNFSDYLSQHEANQLYQDPNFNELKSPAEIPVEAIYRAKDLFLTNLNDKKLFYRWFGSFVTRLDLQAETLLPDPTLLKRGETDFKKMLKKSNSKINLVRNSFCRFAYILEGQELLFFVNGEQWHVDQVSVQLVKRIADNRLLNREEIDPYLSQTHDLDFILSLWCLGFLEFDE